jgi:hypothetical protein
VKEGTKDGRNEGKVGEGRKVKERTKDGRKKGRKVK